MRGEIPPGYECIEGDQQISASRKCRGWLATIDDVDLAISAISIREIWKGIERKRATDVALAKILEAAVRRISMAFDGRILSVDEKVAARWGVLLGQRDKHIDDTGLAATAHVHSLVLVSRNVSDVLDRGADVLDPFKKPARLHKTMGSDE